MWLLLVELRALLTTKAMLGGSCLVAAGVYSAVRVLHRMLVCDRV